MQRFDGFISPKNRFLGYGAGIARNGSWRDGHIGASFPFFTRIVSRVVGQDVSIVRLVDHEARRALKPRDRHAVGMGFWNKDRIVWVPDPGVAPIGRPLVGDPAVGGIVLI